MLITELESLQANSGNGGHGRPGRTPEPRTAAHPPPPPRHRFPAQLSFTRLCNNYREEQVPCTQTLIVSCRHVSSRVPITKAVCKRAEECPTPPRRSRAEIFHIKAEARENYRKEIGISAKLINCRASRPAWRKPLREGRGSAMGSAR